MHNTDRSFDQPKLVYTNFLHSQVFAGIRFLILFNHDNILITAITSIDVRAFINMEIHYTGRVHTVFIKHLLTWATCTTQIDPSINRNLFTRIFYNVKFFAGMWFLILFNHDNILITAITSIDVRAFVHQ